MQEVCPVLSFGPQAVAEVVALEVLVAAAAEAALAASAEEASAAEAVVEAGKTTIYL